MEPRLEQTPAQLGNQRYASSDPAQALSQPAYPLSSTYQPTHTIKSARDSDSLFTHSTHSQTSRLSPLRLPAILPQNKSTTSLLEAVIGRPPTSPKKPTPPTSHIPLIIPPRSVSANSRTSPDGQYSGSGSSEDHATSFGASTEREWDVLSDASLMLNQGEEEEIVEQLQKKVNKRRSNLPHLESQLALLEARIKAAEEKLAKAQSGATRDKGQRRV